MVLITRHNYEAFLLDYIEGNLSEQDTAALMRFLNQNPGLTEDLNDFDWVTLTDDSSSFEGKEDLKIQAEVDELLLSRIEGLNTTSDETRLSALLAAHPQFEKDEKAYAATVLAPEAISFPYKADLKQETRVVPIYFWYSAAAACFIGFMATFGWSTDSPTELQYASGDINLTTSSLAIETIPDFNIFNIDSDSATSDDAVEPAQIVIEDPIDLDDRIPVYHLEPQSNDSNVSDTSHIRVSPPPVNILPKDDIAVIDSIPSIMDSILRSTSPAVLSPEDDNIAMANTNSTPTLGEFINYKTREKVFKDEEPTYSALQSTEILTNVAKGVDKLTSSKVSFEQESTDKGKSTRLKIGKFELYRSAR